MNTSKAASLAFFLLKEITLLNEYERWRRVAKILKLSREAKLKMKWII